MGKILDELGKAELERIKHTSDMLKALEGPISPPVGQWTVLAGPAEKREAHQQVADELNSKYACGECDECTQGNRCREISEEEWEGAMRARDLSELESIFGRLGLDKKLEALKPDLALCKRIIGKDVHYVDERVVFSVKRIVEFIECIDEP